MKTTQTQPPAAHTPLVRTDIEMPRWSTLTTYCEGHDKFPDRVKLYHNGVQIADAPADEYSQALFAEIVTACNAHARPLADNAAPASAQ